MDILLTNGIRGKCIKKTHIDFRNADSLDGLAEFNRSAAIKVSFRL